MTARLQTLPASLTEAEARALRKFQAWLEETMPGQVRRLILFGSKARGEAHPGSDVDLLLELREATPERRDRVLDFAVDLMEDDRIDLTTIIFSDEQLEQQIEMGWPLIRNVAKDGIPLVGGRLVVGKGQPAEVARLFLKSAREHLAAARLLVKAGHGRDVTLLADDAVVDAAGGALAALGVTPKSCAGTLNLFSLHLIKPGRVAGRYGGWLNQIQKWRLEADYERMQPVTEDRAREAFAIAEDFVATVEALIPALLAEQAAQDDSNGADAADGD